MSQSPKKKSTKLSRKMNKKRTNTISMPTPNPASEISLLNMFQSQTFGASQLKLKQLQIENYQNKKLKLQSEFNELERKLKKQKQENIILRTDCEKIEVKLEYAAQTIREQQDNSKKIVENHNDLIQFINGHDKINDDIRENIEKTFEAWENKLKKYQDEDKALTDRVEELEKTFKIKCEEKEELKNLNKKYKSEANYALSTIYPIQCKLEQTENECGRKAAANMKLLKANGDLNEELLKKKKVFSDTVEFCKTKVNKFEELRDKTQNDLKMIEAKHNNLLTEINHLTAEYNQKLNESDNEITKLQEKLNETNKLNTDTIEVKRNENVEIKNKLINAETIIENTKYQLQKTTENANELITDNQNDEKKIAEQKEIIKTLNLQLNDTQKTINDLNEKELDYDNIVDQLKKQLIEKDKECEKLQAQVGRRSEETITRQREQSFSSDSSSVAGPSVSKFNYTRMSEQINSHQEPRIIKTPSPVPKKKAKQSDCM